MWLPRHNGQTQANEVRTSAPTNSVSPSVNNSEGHEMSQDVIFPLVGVLGVLILVGLAIWTGLRSQEHGWAKLAKRTGLTDERFKPDLHTLTGQYRGRPLKAQIVHSALREETQPLMRVDVTVKNPQTARLVLTCEGKLAETQRMLGGTDV